MRFVIAASLMCVTATAPAFAQAPVSPDRRLAALLRQDAGLRERIGQIQLDALVSKVDRTFGRTSRNGAGAAEGAPLRREIDLYTF